MCEFIARLFHRRRPEPRSEAEIALRARVLAGALRSEARRGQRVPLADLTIEAPMREFAVTPWRSRSALSFEVTRPRVRRGGSDHIDNIGPACRPCNSPKGTREEVLPCRT
jgi:hypothetical protein